MSISRHNSLSVFFCYVNNHALQLFQKLNYILNLVFEIHSDVNRYLVVSASCCMQSLSCFADSLRENSFNVHVNIFIFYSKFYLACFYILQNLAETFYYAISVLFRDNALFCKHFCMSHTSQYVMFVQFSVKFYRRIKLVHQ